MIIVDSFVKTHFDLSAKFSPNQRVIRTNELLLANHARKPLGQMTVHKRKVVGQMSGLIEISIVQCSLHYSHIFCMRFLNTD